MSRIHSLLLALGVALIAVGVLADRGARRGDPVGSNDRAVAEGSLETAFPSTAWDRTEDGPATIRAATRSGTGAVAAQPPPLVIARLRHRGEDVPAAGARVGLWRQAKGDGAAFRPERRIAQDQQADANGVARFEARTGFELMLVARTRDSGPTVRIPIPELRAGEERVLDVLVERPPAPLRLVVRSTTGDALAGASIRGVLERRPGAREPGTLIRRTNGAGVADLDGSARAWDWLLVEAAGFGPVAISRDTIASSGQRIESEDDRREKLPVTLSRAARLDVSATTAKGDPFEKALVEVEFTIDGFTRTLTAVTDRRGNARIGGIPPGTSAAVTVTKKDSSEVLLRKTYELEPGEQKAVQTVR